ncbi:hypothetical protein EJ05DRAFT_481929 [Pseudovirgaria hyperparasitica]|uniref:Protein ARV n=1 Tax=Pseudovirgaria hyperparasitica TaxID=470096 RepID=A0A6A6WLJ7_9PEZI|nr:uncharacterized protein EJ05DRAFT_481929 [Pseudovirgaria hyperparasitica]KAF2763085.1 hypothetical protein EJ05DRAFT_481929 [Pseudovirgaria hyperparasitica]
MVICIECRYPVKNLYTTYSKADDRTLGKGVRLTQCPRCKRFADKYVEHDFVVLFIDLVLIKPQVYRHLLFNKLGREDDKFDPSIVRLGVLLLLFDVYLTWARIEKAFPIPFAPLSSVQTPGQTSLLSAQPLVLQYLFFLALVFSETVAFHVPIRLICSHMPRLPALDVPAWTARVPVLKLFVRRTVVTEEKETDTSGPSAGVVEKYTIPLSPLPYYPHPVPLSTALLVSSCTKLFPILLIIWEYDLPSAATAVSWAVIVNNVAALQILMDCGYVQAMILVAIGAVLRGLVAWCILGIAGLTGTDGMGVLDGIGLGWQSE